MKSTYTISVFVSGGGTNLQAIMDAIESGVLPHIEINSVIADRDCFALERAIDRDIPTYFVDRKSDAFWDDIQEVLPQTTDLIVLAGFLSIIPKEFIQQWEGKIINLHPSLLPKYGGKGMYGQYVHKAVLENKEKESGATVHFVTEGIDEGQIILQDSVQVAEDDTPHSLAQKIHAIEHPLLIQAIQKLSQS